MPNIQNYALDIGHLSLADPPFDELDPQERKSIRRMLRALFATGANEVVETILKGLTGKSGAEEP